MHAVGVFAYEDVRDRGASALGNGDGVLVVFTDEDDGQLPEGRKVEAFVKGSLIRPSIPKEAGDDLARAP